MRAPGLLGARKLDPLVLVTDVYGGRGGIAQFNRDLIQAMIAHPRVERITVLPRLLQETAGAVPAGVRFVEAAAAGRVAYAACLAREVLRGNYGAVVCGHLHLLPLAALAARRDVPLVLVIHGMEAWRELRRIGLRAALRRVTCTVAVSQTTLNRFREWGAEAAARGGVILNSVDLSRFRMGARPAYLESRYGLQGRRVLLSLTRLAEPARAKGLDGVIMVLPRLLARFPNLTYVIAGDGPDRRRLERLAEEVGVADRIVFTGYVDEREKPDHYRLADAFALVGRGEGFGITILEAMACGIPVVASTADGSREAVLDGQLGLLADPDVPDSIEQALAEALRQPRGVSPRLQEFSAATFGDRWRHLLDTLPTKG